MEFATSKVRLAFNPEAGWGLEAKDVKTGQILALGDKAPLFELILAEPDGGEVSLTAAKAGATKVSRGGAAGAEHLEIEFLSLGGREIDVVCRVSTHADGSVGFRASIRNREARPVRALRYPILTLNPHPSTDDDDYDQDTFLLMPMLEVFTLLRNPHRWMPSPYPYMFKYLRDVSIFGRSPGNLSAQFFAYYGSDAGLYSAAHDSKGWLKELAIDRIDGFARLSWLNYFPELDVKEQALDYDLVLSTFQGDWYDAADLYKVWAHRQPWCVKTLLQRTDLPEWITRGSVWLTLDNWTKEPDGELRYYGKPMSALMARWQAILPQPPVLHYRWTDKYAYAATFLDWKPFFPSDQHYIDTLGEEKKHGIHAWLMVNGYNLTISEGANANGGQAHDERARFLTEAAKYAVRNPQGKIDEWTLSWIPQGVNVELCRGTAWAHDFLNNIAERYSQVGFSLCQMDQTIGGGGAICYAKDHDHPPGGGLWLGERFKQQLRSFFEIGRRADPEFHVSEEGPNELFIQELGVFQSRDHAELPPGVDITQLEKPWDIQVAPVFDYVYHAYLIGYTSWAGMWAGDASIPASEEGWETIGVTALAKSLIYGRLPGVWERFFTPETTSNSRRHKILVQHAALTGGDEKRYLLFGTMLRPPPIKTDTTPFTFKYKTGLHRDYPRVLRGAFEDAKGQRAVFLVNVSNEATQCVLDLKSLKGKRSQASECRLVKQKTVRKTVVFQGLQTVDLAPLEIMYLELS